MIGMLRVPMPVVDVIDVIAVSDGLVAAVVAVLMRMVRRRLVRSRLVDLVAQFR